MSTRGALLAIGLLGGCNAVFGIDDTDLANRNPRTIVFDNSAASSDVVDLPVLVQLNPARIEYEQVTDPATQLRFHDPVTGADLPFEIEHWENGGDSAVWVLVPRIAARSTSTMIEMHFGAGAGGQETPSDVWESYPFVVHAGSRGFASTPGGFTPRPDGATLASGVIGDAVHFRADTDEIVFDGTASLISGWPTFSLEYWIYPENNDGGHLLAKSGPLNLARLEPWPNRMTPLAGIVWHQIDINFSACETQYLNTLIPVAAWTHVVWTYDGTTLWLYRNGTIDNAGTCGVATPLASSTSLFSLGEAGTTFVGALDEIRVGMAPRSTDWIRAQYLAMTGVFVRFPEPGELTTL